MAEMPVATRDHHEIQILKKNAAAVHIKNDISFLQRKLWNVLLYNAYNDLGKPGVEIHEIRLRDLIDHVNCDSKNTPYIKEALTELAITPIHWDLLNKAGKPEWGVSAALASAIIVDGTVSYSFSAHLRPHLFNPSVYARIDIHIVSRFSSGHALALYENCVRYRGIQQTPFIDVNLFRELVGVQGNASYDDFKVLNRAVIKPALSEISAVSDICVDVEFKREKRKIVAMKFLIRDNPQNNLAIGIDTAFDVELLSQLQEDFGLTERQAKEALATHSEDRVRATIEYVTQQFKANKIRKAGSLTPYFLKVLDHGDIPVSEPRLVKEQREELERKRAAAQSAVDADAERRSFAELRLQQAEDYLSNLSQEDREALNGKFEAMLRDKNKVVLNLLKKSGYASQAVRVALIDYVHHHVLPSGQDQHNAMIRAQAGA